MALVHVEPVNVSFDHGPRNTGPARSFPAKGCDTFCSVDRTGVTAVSHVSQVSLGAFFEDYTEFDSLTEFEDALPVTLDNVKDADSVAPDVDEVVQAHSEFDSVRDMVDTAMETWVHRNVDLSEFDIDEDAFSD